MAFADIIGQEGPVSVIRRSLASGKVAHAYIFDGIEGCGKRKTALAFIQAVFCGDGEGCGRCASCRKIAALQHPDLHLVEPDGAFIKIDQIRELQRELAYRPYEAPKKACVIEGVERMNPSAANAFLKTLEEPPGDALLILLTSNLAGVLATIRSRCQRLTFSPLPMGGLERRLVENGMGEEEARVAASLAGGSLARALEIAGGESLEKRRQLLERVGALGEGGIAALFDLAEELGGERDKAMEFLDMLTLFWRDVLLLHGGVDQVANIDLLPLARREAESTDMDGAMERLEAVSRSRHALTRNVNPRLALEVLFMRLAGHRVV